MDLIVFLVVILAALFHAIWNAFIKVNGDRLIFMAVLLAASGVGALITTPFLPLPAPESWPYIALSVLFHQGYTVFLLIAYRYGDLSHVYPLARGSAPLIVALFSIVLLQRKARALPQIGRVWKPAVLMGLMSLAAYWAVIWAMTVAPIALVAALRETSIIFALLFGVVFLKERLSLARLAASFATLAGTILLKMSRP